MHSNALEVRIDCGEQPDHFYLVAHPQPMQRPSAVLTAAPGKKNFRLHDGTRFLNTKKKGADTSARALSYLPPTLCVNQFHTVNRMPTGCGLELVVDVVDVPDAFGLKPLAERGRSLLRVYRDAVLPRRAPAEHAIEFHSRLARKFERLGKFRIADARRQINERLGRSLRSGVEVVDGFLFRVSLGAAEALHALNKHHVHRHFDLQHVD